MSVFRLPFPPFFKTKNGHYSIESVDVDEAEELGIRFDDFKAYEIDALTVHGKLLKVPI
jgi:hypothetical protein